LAKSGVVTGAYGYQPPEKLTTPMTSPGLRPA
jgi:hypothetical protein